MKIIISLYSGIVLLLFCEMQTLNAQETSKVDYPNFGISFHVPEGWVGNKVASGFAITSSETEGVVLIITHDEHSIADMEQEAKNGFQISKNTLLTPINGVEKIMDNAIAGLYTGTIDTKPTKALIVGMINPYGYGLTILCAAETTQFTEDLKTAGLMVTASVMFYNPKTQTIINSTQEESIGLSKIFKNCRLTYMESYSTSGGGYNNRTTIDLCGEGYFKHSSVSSVSMDTGESSGYGGNNKQGAGTWRMLKKQNQTILQLNFYNGEIYDYIITIDEDDKTYLNGERYFRTYKDSGKYSPDCE
ncbi:hypothetical protein [Yeosuana marina]|uniref:hypothetical protein n=1 Tax=Yeosuana marina TaxID=1565536 RepID=UPI00142184DE|nr:hypothetical protein [Yeosuana marina]